MGVASSVAIVTGGSKGIGKAIALEFAAKGIEVIIWGRDAAALEQVAASSERIHSFKADVTNRQEIEETVARIVEQYGRIDILVNNAGSGGSVTTSTDPALAEQIWDDVQAANLKSAFLVSLAVAPHMNGPHGRIINISSVAAYSGGGGRISGVLAYASAKAGLHGLTYALAQELGPRGITVNAIAPGLIGRTQFFGGDLPEERARATSDSTPAGRVGIPEDIAAAAAYLASPEASYVTGEVLNVNGGLLFGR